MTSRTETKAGRKTSVLVNIFVYVFRDGSEMALICSLVPNARSFSRLFCLNWVTLCMTLPATSSFLQKYFFLFAQTYSDMPVSTQDATTTQTLKHIAQ